MASILNYFGIPFLQINPSLGWDNEQTLYNSSVNLYPSRKILSQASVTSVVELEGIDIRGHSLTTYFDKVSAFLATFLHRVDIYEGIPLLLCVKICIPLSFLVLPTYLPRLVNVVCERPLM